jgi:hypothetical protein
MRILTMSWAAVAPVEGEQTQPARRQVRAVAGVCAAPWSACFGGSRRDLARLRDAAGDEESGVCRCAAPSHSAAAPTREENIHSWQSRTLRAFGTGGGIAAAAMDR